MKWNSKIIILISGLLVSTSLFAQSANPDDLKSKIDERNNKIKQLQAEIDQYNNQVLEVGNQAKTLQNTLKSLDLTQKKISTDINLTQTKISKASLTLDELSGEIFDTQSHIDLNRKAISSAIQNIQSADNNSIVEVLLSRRNLNDIWSDFDNMNQIQSTIRDKSKELQVLENDLQSKHSAVQDQKHSLLSLNQDLSDKKQVVLANKQAQSSLLSQTKNKESEYKKIIADKQSQVAQYEKELFDYESQLNLITNPNQIPGAHRGMLNWPLDNIKITQLFGVTGDSKRLYVSGSHNGVDFHAPIGTPVKAALDGTIVGLGNTDIFPGCYSFGQWIMIKHNNGLSTVYGHLSLIKVVVGQNVASGDIIGLSGYSGYVYPPGPLGAHLHLGVYATAGVEIQQFVNSRGCKQAIVPIADIRAYLDPMLYLPNA